MLFDPLLNCCTEAKYANYFICPITIIPPVCGEDCEEHYKVVDKIINITCDSMKYFKNHSNQHIFLLHSDKCYVPKLISSSKVFQQSCHKDSKHIAIHYMTNDIFNYVSISNAEYDVAFYGLFETHPIRYTMAEKVKSWKLKCFLQETPNYWRSDLTLRRKMEIEWQQILLNSKFILCPRGRGLNTVRFFQTICCGRIPILIADEAKLPCENLIDYSDFIIRVSEDEMDTIPDRIVEFKNIDVKSRRAREVWLRYFHPSKIEYFMELNLDKRQMFL
jgi:hypothetical protein